MARYLSPEWVQSFDAALGALDLSDAIAAAGSGSLAAADGAFTVAQLVSGVPADVGAGSGDGATGPDTVVGLVLSVADGRAHLALDPDGAQAAAATATIALGYADALELALGRLDPADALAAGRVRVRGDLAALVAGQAVLAAAATRLGSAFARFSPDSRPPSFGGRYAGKVVVVTGASAGLGAQLGRDLARAGAIVIGLARSTARLDALAAELRVHSPQSATFTCDVADTDALREVLTKVEALHGAIDMLVNNAAQDPGVRLVDIGEDDYRHAFDVNFFAPVAATLAVTPSMVARGEGIVINVSSDGGRLPSPGPGAYPSSKAALSAFSESVSFRLGPKGVRLHVVYPAFMATELGLGALGRGLRKPPRLTRRSVPRVSRRILAQAGGPSLEISVSGLIDAAMVFRALMPRTYHRLRHNW
jgi:NAD(P)-dependent dehydrogenase (short-subunit alcohol dehydrogenase family)